MLQVLDRMEMVKMSEVFRRLGGWEVVRSGW